ncbi:MAG: DNA repair protein RecO [Bernardetiaceae bacterium]
MKLYTTKGIVFNFIKYKETSIICKVFTETFGVRSYMIKGVRKKKATLALYQPLTQLELLVSEQETRDIQQVRDVRVQYAYASIPFEIKKTSIGLFLAEILYKSVREENPQPLLYTFVTDSFCIFDTMDAQAENFHLQFLLKLPAFLGFGMEEGATLFGQTGQLLIPDRSSDQIVNQLLQEPYGTPCLLNGYIRRQLLQHLLRFYALHVENFGRVRSLDVLQNIF